MIQNADIIRGLDLYKQFSNINKNRKSIEERASKFIDSSHKTYTAYLNFMKSDFHYWMMSRADFQNYNDSLKSLSEDMFNELITFDARDLKTELCKLIRQFYGIGPVMSSSMIAVLRPEEFGVVNKYVLHSINNYKLFESILDEEDISTDSIVVAEKLLREISNKFQDCSLGYNPRMIDMALWGLGKQDLKK